MLVLSIAAHAHAVALDGSMAWIATTPALPAFAVATVAEVVAYKVPALDNALDLVASPCAVVAGVLVAQSQFQFAGADGELLRWAAAVILGGGIAGVVQSATVIVRAKSTAFTAGLANPVFALVETATSVALSVLAVVAPALAAALLLVVVAPAARAPTRRRTRGATQAGREPVVASD